MKLPVKRTCWQVDQENGKSFILVCYILLYQVEMEQNSRKMDSIVNHIHNVHNGHADASKVFTPYTFNVHHGHSDAYQGVYTLHF